MQNGRTAERQNSRTAERQNSRTAERQNGRTAERQNGSAQLYTSMIWYTIINYIIISRAEPICQAQLFFFYCPESSCSFSIKDNDNIVYCSILYYTIYGSCTIGVQTLAEQQNGRTAERQNGRMAEQQNSRTAERQNSRTAEGQNGRTAERQNGSAQLYTSMV